MYFMYLDDYAQVAHGIVVLLSLDTFFLDALCEGVALLPDCICYGRGYLARERRVDILRIDLRKLLRRNVRFYQQ